MSVKRKVVDKRLTLFRTCGICGKSFVTTADTPWVRQVPRDGKRQATTYYREYQRQYRLTDPEGYKADRQYQYKKARLKAKQGVVV